jgi:hypothetical protein
MFPDSFTYELPEYRPLIVFMVCIKIEGNTPEVHHLSTKSVPFCQQIRFLNFMLMLVKEWDK